MNAYIILLRGINVGGRNILPMKELKALLDDQGFVGVKSYIQSGNVVLKSTKKSGNDIGSLIEDKFGFAPDVLTLSENQLALAIANNPYQGLDGKTVHFYFCKEAPNINQAKINQIATPTESYKLEGNVFYLNPNYALETYCG